MQTRRIGSLDVSVVGLGCNNFGGRLDAADTAKVVGAAIDAGITLFDTADIYGGTHSEEYLGRALGNRRDEVIVATKFGMDGGGLLAGGASATYVKESVHASLTRLGTDRIDLYQLHMPDKDTPIAETLEALDLLVTEGKVREIGCSNFSAAQIAEAAEAGAKVGGSPGGRQFASVQNHYSLLHREPEAEVLPECERRGLAFLPYFPLANGLLSGKYVAGRPAPEGTRIAGMGAERSAQLLSGETMAKVSALTALGAEVGHTLLEVAVGWLLSRPAVASVIAGATTPSQIGLNAAAGAWVPGPELLERIDEICPA
jgi:aryl-alcohol dehydrogenase-like predicted oxidoreductase